jgi:hypothetical protein
VRTAISGLSGSACSEVMIESRRDHRLAVHLHVQGPEVVGGAAQQVVEVARVGGPAAGLLLPRLVHRIEASPGIVQAPQRKDPLPGVLGIDLPFQLDRLLAVQPQLPPRGGRRQLVGRVPEADHALHGAPVEAAIGEDQGVAPSPGREVLAAHIAAPAPDLENVREVGTEGDLDPIVERAPEIAGERQTLDQPVGQCQLTPDVDDVPGIPGVPAEREIVDRQVDHRPVGTRDLGRQENGRAPADRQSILTQNPGVVLKEAQRAGAGRRDVPVQIHQQEEPVVLQYQRVLRHRLVGAGHPRVADRVLHGDRNQRLGRDIERLGRRGRAERPAHAAVIGRRAVLAMTDW